MHGVELSQILERRLQSAAHAPERRGLLLDDFIVQDIDGRAESMDRRHCGSILRQVRPSMNSTTSRVKRHAQKESSDDVGPPPRGAHPNEDGPSPGEALS